MSSVHPIYEGVGITGVGNQTAAEIAGIEPGMIMISFNNTNISTQAQFSEAISLTSANQTVDIELYDPQTGTIITLPANLTDKSLATENAEDSSKGYLGINSMTLSDSYFHPIGESKTISDVTKSLSIYMTLPLQGLSPLDGNKAEFYEVSGFWSFMPINLFWILTNICYWIFWLNLMVGLSNALPAIPLDGGYIFKDWLDSILEKMSAFADTAKRTKTVDYVAFIVALTILFMILWQVIGPQIL
jgi:membrane-associated protease RseP (regulator of RpoE activity)